jgi:glycosyltransferase involved in cell wall biosynthesis
LRCEKRNLLFLITSGGTGGAQEYVRHCCAHFQEKFRVFLGAGTEGALTEAAREMGVPVFLVDALAKNGPRPGDFFAFRKLVRLIREIAPALVSCHSTKAGFVGRLAARAAGVPAVFTAHGWGFSEGTPPLRRRLVLWAERYAAPLASRIICVSAFDRDLALACSVGRPEQLAVVRNGVPPLGVDGGLRADPGGGAVPGSGRKDEGEMGGREGGGSSPAAGEAASGGGLPDVLAAAGSGGRGGPPDGATAVRLVMVARFSPQKDHPLLLRALAGLRELPWELWLVGGGEREGAVRREALRLDLGDRVRFFGERRDVPEILAAGHVFVLASRWEGLPLTVLEAMRAGLPVVAADVGGVREAVVHGETGLLFPRGDAGALRRCLELLIASPAERVRLGAAGRARWEKEFTLERMLKETEAVYRAVLEGGGG